MPAWISAGFTEYAKRLPKDYQLQLIELPLATRTKTSAIDRCVAAEGQAILTKLPKNSLLITLDEHGEEWNTKQLAQKLKTWHDETQDICLCIGGPDGLDQSVLIKAAKVWSLSKLTLPHPIVRILVAEQLYRAWSIIQQHPYHRS
jgi:23S rRNA (pseudouridine1915-N3)-methyltransferase